MAGHQKWQPDFIELAGSQGGIPVQPDRGNAFRELQIPAMAPAGMSHLSILLSSIGAGQA
jgi:hypothetical protein